MSTGAPARVVLGVSGGIAAYKAAILLRLLGERHRCDVTVVPTAAALAFVGEATWAGLSGHPVASDVWHEAHRVPHVRLGQQADLVVVVPATADLLARAAHGLADDLLTSTLLTARCPVLMAPAMHTEMWQHPATQANVAVLRGRGVVVLDPAHGRLTGADSGPGRLPEPEEIAAVAVSLLPRRGDLAGHRVVISAGGTREPIDPVRYLGNRSSGRQGYALAVAAALRGADVVLVSANVEAPDPAGVEVVRVGTAQELRAAVLDACAGGEHARRADVVVMAAAVADFRPAQVADSKVKKRHGPGHEDEVPVITLERTPDVLGELASRRAADVVVGFAAETGDADGSVMDHARAKFARKGCDLLVVNDVSGGKVFGRDDTEVAVLDAAGVHAIPAGSKAEVAEAVWDAVLAWRARAEGP